MHHKVLPKMPYETQIMDELYRADMNHVKWKELEKSGRWELHADIDRNFKKIKTPLD